MKTSTLYRRDCASRLGEPRLQIMRSCNGSLPPNHIIHATMMLSFNQNNLPVSLSPQLLWKMNMNWLLAGWAKDFLLPEVKDKMVPLTMQRTGLPVENWQCHGTLVIPEGSRLFLREWERLCDTQRGLFSQRGKCPKGSGHTSEGYFLKVTYWQEHLHFKE